MFKNGEHGVFGRKFSQKNSVYFTAQHLLLLQKKRFLLETLVDIFSEKISKDAEILKVLEFLTG